MGKPASPCIAVIEIPSGGIVKREYRPKRDRLEVDRVLPRSFGYPAHYGCILGTVGGDRDPLDALVISRAKLKPGQRLAIRALGLLRMRDRGREDAKILAAPADVPAASARRRLTTRLRDRLQRFFESYKGRAVTIDGWSGARAAEAEIARALKRARNGTGPR
jgi:inorganic pyrophosphatase